MAEGGGVTGLGVGVGREKGGSVGISLCGSLVGEGVSSFGVVGAMVVGGGSVGDGVVAFNVG